MKRFTRWYGAGPLHMLALLVALLVSGYAAFQLFGVHRWVVLYWLAGGVIGHDLLLLPLYALADRSVAGVIRHRRSWEPPEVREHAVPAVNHIRVPVILSGLLLMAWFPLILRLSPGFYQIITGLHESVFLPRWVGVTAFFFAVSAVTYAIRLGRHARAGKR
jgi:hypothetical protein